MGVRGLPPRDVKAPSGCRCNASASTASTASSARERPNAPAGISCNYRGFPGARVEFDKYKGNVWRNACTHRRGASHAVVYVLLQDHGLRGRTRLPSGYYLPFLPLHCLS